MAKPRIFVTRIIPQAGLDLLMTYCEADIWQGVLPPTRSELLEKVIGVDGLLCLLTDTIDGEIMDAAGPQLKVISNHAVGYDNVDVKAATRRGIPVGNTPGILTDATADFAWALLMAAARRIPEAQQFVRQGQWVTWGPSLLLGADFSGATLGIIGYGRIGQAVASRAQGFGMRILYTNPTVKTVPGIHAEQVDLVTLLSESDFISLHCPLNAATTHLINDQTLRMMKSTAVLVNTARGGVVDQDALYKALAEKQIFAAALDVTTPEPLPHNHPLLTLENCLVVPHIASASQRTRDNMAILAANNLLAGLRGERLPHCVNPGVYRN